MISIIVAIADNGAIGRNNQLLWHISEDLRYFKKITFGHTVIMGRKTWESVGKPLPGRRNIIVSSTLNSRQLAGIEVFPSLEAAIAAAEQPPVKQPTNFLSSTEISENTKITATINPEIFIIGGGEIYRQAFPLARRLYLTLVHITIDNADTFFPFVDLSDWKELSRESFPMGEKFPSPFEFVVMERK